MKTEKTKLYIRTSSDEHKVCDDLTDEVIAIFFNQKDAVEYTEIIKQRNELLRLADIANDMLDSNVQIPVNGLLHKEIKTAIKNCK